MKVTKLKTSQKNEFFDLITKSHFGVEMFNYEDHFNEESGDSKVIIKDLSQSFYFEIKNFKSGYGLEFSPGYDKLHETLGVINWGEIVSQFDKWLYRLKDEINSGDKWEEFKKIIEDTSLSTDTNLLNDKFTVPEYLEIKSKIDLLRTELSKVNLTSLQLNSVNNKLDLLMEQTKSLGKFDWRSLFIGTIMSIILQLSLSQEQGKLIWIIIKQIFSNYFLISK